LLPRLNEGLASRDEETAFRAAVTLSFISPDTEGVVEKLSQHLEDPKRQWEAANSLYLMGPDALLSAPNLSTILEKEAAEAASGFAGGDAAFPGAGMGDYGSSYGSSYGSGYGEEHSGGMGMGGSAIGWQVLTLLENMGSKATDALPMLRRIAQQEGPYGQKARELIKKIQGRPDPTQPAPDSSESDDPEPENQ
jgi:hypothetical protein